MLFSEAVQAFGAYSRREAGHTSHEPLLPDPRAELCPLAGGAGSLRPARSRDHRRSYPALLLFSLGAPASSAYHTRRPPCSALLLCLPPRDGALPGNPALGVRLPKKDAATRLLVTDDDLGLLLDAAGRQYPDFRCVRDRAILAVLIYGGLRRQELLDLTMTSPKRAGSHVRVT
jgi:hypothetical protein